MFQSYNEIQGRRNMDKSLIHNMLNTTDCEEFLEESELLNLVNDSTCFKGDSHPSAINFFI